MVFGLAEWGAKWQFGDPRPNEIDPELLLWWAHLRLDYSELPDRRIVLHFVFTDIRRQFWIVKDVSGPSVCQHDPGFEIDVRVQTDIETMAHVWYEVTDLRTALRSGAIELIGAPALVRRMPKVLQLPEGGFLPTEPVGARAQS